MHRVNEFSTQLGGTMNRGIRPVRGGLVSAMLLGGWHLLWAVLVALGLAQPLIDFIFWLHFIKPVYVVGSFDIWIGALLVGLTALFGYGVGWVLAVLWNKIHGTD